MKFTLALLGVTAAISDVEQAYMSYIAKHGKSYATREEYEFRLAQFAKKFAYVQAHNALNDDDHTVEVNHMADWTDSEYKRILGYRRSNKTRQASIKVEAVKDLPASVNWVTAGAVTPVKNQGQCGSCWSFSTTGAIEGAMFLSTGNLQSYSEQQLVDCSRLNHGCNGGSMALAFTYTQTHPLELESDYPYTAKDGKCAYVSSKGQGKVKAYTNVP